VWFVVKKCLKQALREFIEGGTHHLEALLKFFHSPFDGVEDFGIGLDDAHQGFGFTFRRGEGIFQLFLLVTGEADDQVCRVDIFGEYFFYPELKRL
jgi:hypothetical protein